MADRAVGAAPRGVPAGPSVLTFGETLLALVARPPGPLVEADHFTPHVVGAESNVAIGLARLGHEVGVVGRVGADDFGVMIVRRLRAEGVDTSLLTLVDAPTGLLFRNLRATAPSSVTYRRLGSAGASLDARAVDEALDGRDAALVAHVSGVTPALSSAARGAFEALCTAAENRRCRLSLDLNYRSQLWSEREARAVLRVGVATAWVVTATEREAMLVTGAGPGESAAALVELGAELAVVRDGPYGATLRQASSGASTVVAGTSVHGVVDTVGAGDAFAAGLLSGLLDGVGAVASVARAHRCGAAVIGAVGDIEAALTRAELDAALDEEVRR